MTHALPHHWRLWFIAASIATLLVPDIGVADSAGGQLLLRPHCELAQQEQCPQYLAEDPTTLQTPPLKVGDTLDLDVAYLNTTSSPVQRVRAWIAYDPAVFEGKTVSVLSVLPLTTPGETDFSPQDGYIRIQATHPTRASTDPIIPVARIQLTVKSVPAGSSWVLSFYDVKAGIDGHTFAAKSNQSTEQNLLAPEQSALRVYLQGTPTAATSSTVATAVSSSADATSSQAAPPAATTDSSEATATTFPLLQVQNVTVTTEGSAIFLAWDALRSSELQGYNVYYGTKSGQYVQRKSVAADATSLALRGLPLDAVYYLAVRGVSRSNQESAFSQEVGVKVGDPATATSPMRGLPKGAPKNPVKTGTTSTVPGEAGLPSLLLLVLIMSASAGTLAAFRRQLGPR